MKNKNNGR